MFRLLLLKEYCVLERSVGTQVVGSWSGLQAMTGYGLEPPAFMLENFDDSLRNFAVDNCVGIIKVFVCRSLLINVPFEGVDMDAFLLKL